MIREATADDYPRFATLLREGIAEPTPTPTPTPTRERWVTTLVHERDGRVDGYVSYVTLSDTAHVRDLVVAPEARNAGIGTALMRAAASTLRAHGMAEWHLNVRRGNAAAIAVYENLGMEVEHASTVLRMPWTTVRELPREFATALPVAPDEDGDIETALGLVSGRIAMGRVRPDRIQIQLRDARCAPVGFATFDPALGASPFRVARPALAATLLEALAPHAISEHVQVVVEDDQPLTDQLAAHGAERRLELLHYCGRL